MTGLELFLDFEGTSYKTTLRSPDANGMKRYVFNLSDMAANGKTPTYASVAPIFLERGRSFVGKITSNALMPFAKIALDIADLVYEISLDEGDGDFVIVLDNDVLELDYGICNPGSPVEDPWGGCAVSVQDMLNVTQPSGPPEYFIYLPAVETSWLSSHRVKFTGVGGDCVDDDYSGSCNVIDGGLAVSKYITLDDMDTVTLANPCDGESLAYIYDNSNCE